MVLDIRKPRFGDPLPETMRDYVGAVIFGGPMSANDPDDYVRAEIDWIGVALRENKPFLGICLGGQMLAKHLGERVYKHADGRVEIGYYPIRPTAELEELCRRCETRAPSHVYHWHREGFDLPKGATLLADGDEFPVQAFRSGASAYAIQFHPEVTYAMMCRWTTLAGDRMNAPGAKARDFHLDGWFQYDAAVARWIERFLRLWAAGGAAAEPAEKKPRAAAG
jgi:GMP synthase (glutamine-hydrolysing)